MNCGTPPFRMNWRALGCAAPALRAGPRRCAVPLEGGPTRGWDARHRRQLLQRIPSDPRRRTATRCRSDQPGDRLPSRKSCSPSSWADRRPGLAGGQQGSARLTATTRAPVPRMVRCSAAHPVVSPDRTTWWTRAGRGLAGGRSRRPAPLIAQCRQPQAGAIVANCRLRNQHDFRPAQRNRSASIDDSDGRVVSGLLASPGMDRIAIIMGVVIMFWMLWYFLAGRDR